MDSKLRVCGLWKHTDGQGRVGEVIGAMERDVENGENDVAVARLKLLNLEMAELVRSLVGGNS